MGKLSFGNIFDFFLTFLVTIEVTVFIFNYTPYSHNKELQEKRCRKKLDFFHISADYTIPKRLNVICLK